MTLVEMCSHLATERAGLGTLHLTEAHVCVGIPFASQEGLLEAIAMGRTIRLSFAPGLVGQDALFAQTPVVVGS